jgi:hypothetical protein
VRYRPPGHDGASTYSPSHEGPVTRCAGFAITVACHVWDTIGALSAGWQAGLILREGNAPLDAGPQPTYIGKDLDAIADQLIEHYPG